MPARRGLGSSLGLGPSQEARAPRQGRRQGPHSCAHQSRSRAAGDSTRVGGWLCCQLSVSEEKPGVALLQGENEPCLARLQPHLDRPADRLHASRAKDLGSWPTSRGWPSSELTQSPLAGPLFEELKKKMNSSNSSMSQPLGIQEGRTQRRSKFPGAFECSGRGPRSPAPCLPPCPTSIELSLPPAPPAITREEPE